MIKKLRAGMMPPPTVTERPPAATLAAFATSLETTIDNAAALHPTPGHRMFQRLTRAEYERAVHDVLGLDVDVNAFLPPDTISAGFDNIADAQQLSPTLLEGYLRAAAEISNLAIGDRTASPTEATYKVPRTESQTGHVDGTPWGTRGGIAVDHTFPADGEYSFRIMLHGTPTGQLFGSVSSRNEQIDLSLDGERVALMDVELPDHRDRQGGPQPHDPAHLRQGGSAPRHRGVHSEIRRRHRRPDEADRLHARRHRIRRQRRASRRSRTCAISASPARSA